MRRENAADATIFPVLLDPFLVRLPFPAPRTAGSLSRHCYRSWDPENLLVVDEVETREEEWAGLVAAVRRLGGAASRLLGIARSSLSGMEDVFRVSARIGPGGPRIPGPACDTPRNFSTPPAVRPPPAGGSGHSAVESEHDHGRP